jgi:ADP-ribosylglycohydrolase
MTTPRPGLVAGSLFGLALGDALGAPTEFMTIAAIERRYGPAGPSAPSGNPARVTDDTQMAIAVGQALVVAAAREPLTAATVEGPLTAQLVSWHQDTDNTRAPGATCLAATTRLAAGERWMAATVPYSKGCEANMRVTPVGLLPDGWADASTRAALAQYQAAFTHGHPTALAASDLTARAVAELVDRCPPGDLVAALRDYAHGQRRVWHGDWLAELWQGAGVARPEQFIARAWDDCLEVLDRLNAALAVADRHRDPCVATGAGWTAEEALATALLCFLLLNPDRPVPALRRAATTSGDSDSIACLTGALAGAVHGLDAWPADWRERVEYRRDIYGLSGLLCGAAVGCEARKGA